MIDQDELTIMLWRQERGLTQAEQELNPYRHLNSNAADRALVNSLAVLAITAPEAETGSMEDRN